MRGNWIFSGGNREAEINSSYFKEAPEALKQLYSKNNIKNRVRFNATDLFHHLKLCMNKELKSIMLIDDNTDDHFFHQRTIRKSKLPITIITMHSGMEALKYLRSKAEPHADLIFLDINMPVMSGWEVLEEYNKLDKELQSHAIVMMLTTSPNPDDEIRAKTIGNIYGYVTKPLTLEILTDISEKYFASKVS